MGRVRASVTAPFVLVFMAASFLTAPDAIAAFPGANGRIAFYSNRDGNFDIFSMNPDGSDPLNLTNNPAFDGTPAWSADGARVAFVSFRAPGGLYVMNADGSNQTLVTSFCMTGFPAWSPDGSKIAFTSCGDDIYVVNVDGTGLTNLTNTEVFDRFPSWSPDGTRIAFSRIDFSTFEDDIWVMDADGSNPANLTNNSAIEELHPDWSPDGSRIAYFRDDDIFVMNADGTEQTNLTNTPSVSEAWPAWSPDGTTMALQVCGTLCDVWTMNAGGSNRVNLTGASGANNFVPDWQPLPIQLEIDVTFRDGTALPPTGTAFVRGRVACGELARLSSLTGELRQQQATATVAAPFTVGSRVCPPGATGWHAMTGPAGFLPGPAQLVNVVLVACLPEVCVESRIPGPVEITLKGGPTG